MHGAPPGRLALFALCCVLLAAAALGFAQCGTAPAPRAGPPAVSVSGLPASARRLERRAARAEAVLRRAARPFLVAFLDYEAGRRGFAIAGALRAGATRAFAARLLDAPPLPSSPAGYPGPARLGELSVSFLSARPDSALVRASAERGGLPEQLSFLFARRGGRWVASAPGQ